MKQYWILKTEPETYGWDDLIKNPVGDIWDGIRNYQARNNLAAMKTGDIVLIYHSGKTRNIVGQGIVTEAAFPDPADKEKKGWLAIKIKAKKLLENPVSLQAIKNHPDLKENGIVKQSRLSVIELTEKEYEVIQTMAKTGST